MKSLKRAMIQKKMLTRIRSNYLDNQLTSKPLDSQNFYNFIAIKLTTAKLNKTFMKTYLTKRSVKLNGCSFFAYCYFGVVIGILCIASI